ncbi:MAG: hypothetical protein RIQ81_84 [Pseudomonadota bacterium]
MNGISNHGVWLLVDGVEYFAPFELFPWFRSATIKDVHDVKQPHPGHLYWPGLDVDLHVNSLQNPEAFPLVAVSSKKRPGKKKSA